MTHMASGKKPRPASDEPPAGRPGVSRFFATLPEVVAGDYHETRYLPEDTCVHLFQGEVQGAPCESRKRLLDVGTGIGRLAIPVAASFPLISILGIDVSPAMVAIARKRAESRRLPETRLQFTDRCLFEFVREAETSHQAFDFVLCHWCFHCIRPWRSALLACARLTTASGKLLWLEEESDLYRALDDLEDPTKDRDARSRKPWLSFWSYYHRRLSAIEPNARAEQRLGTSLRCTDEIKAFLRFLGWGVEADPAPVTWNIPRSYGWIIDHCLAPRSFTNLQRIPQANHDRVVEELRTALGHSDDLPRADEYVDISYSAKLVRAFRSPAGYTREAAAHNIRSTCLEIYPEVFDLSCAADDQTGFKLLRQVLANFFAALFRTDGVPAWKAFWQESGEPEWVWIRLAESPTSDFQEFLEQKLWAFAADTRLFENVLQPYFTSGAHTSWPRIHHGSESWRPVVLNVDGSARMDHFVVERADTSGVVRISVPQQFVDRYCETSPSPGGITAAEWLRNSTKGRAALFKRPPADETRDLQRELETFTRKLDQDLGVRQYAQNPGRFVEYVQAIRLFPGTCYYFFPVRGVHGELVSSISLGLPRGLSDCQIDVLRECVDRLLTIPSLVLGRRSAAAR